MAHGLDLVGVKKKKFNELVKSVDTSQKVFRLYRVVPDAKSRRFPERFEFYKLRLKKERERENEEKEK